MRIAVCAFSAVLLSGCSWFGGSSHSNAYSYGYGNGGASYGCSAGAYGGQQTAYGYGQAATYRTGGCGATNSGGYGLGAGGMGAGGYGMGANGYGAGLRGGQAMAGQTMGANGYGPAGFGGAYGGNGFGATGLGATGMGAGGMYGAGAGGAYGAVAGASGFGGATGGGYGTVLGGAAPYGAAVGGGAAGTQLAGGRFVNGQWVAGSVSGGVSGGFAGGGVTTIQGSPIFVPQPYPAYYGVGYNAGYAGGSSYGYGYGYGGGMRGASVALPFGLEFGVGTEFSVGGDIVGAKPAGPGSGGGVHPLNVSATPAIAYTDAYKTAVNLNAATTYDVSPSTTLLASLGYSKAEGQSIHTGTIDDGTLTEDLYAQWGDLEQFTVEGGVRQYMGGWNNGISGMRPYVGASAGFTHNNDVSLTQSSATLMPVGANTQNYLQSGWTPTASGVIGAEMQVGARTAIGVETGIRWRDDINSIQQQDDRWSVPLKLRGRISF